MTEDFSFNQPLARVLRIWFCGTFSLVLMSDQVTKKIMLELIFDPPQRIQIAGIINLTPVWNRGMSFGMLADGGPMVPIGLTSLAVVVSIWLFWMVPRFDQVQRLAAGLIAGGAIGNAIDRLRFGKVVDFIDVHYAGLHWPAFNLADAGITVGAILWGYSIFRGQETGRI